MLRKVFLVVFFSLALGAAIWAYFYLRSIKQPGLNALLVLPENTEWIAESNSWPDFIQQFRHENACYDILKNSLQLNKMEKVFLKMDSTFHENENLNSYLIKTPVYISGWENKTFITFNLQDLNQGEAWINTCVQNLKGFHNTKKKINNAELYELGSLLPGWKMLVIEGLVIIGENSDNISDFINKPEKLEANKDFKYCYENRSDDAPLRIYLRNSVLSDKANYFISERLKSQIATRFNSQNWSSIDIELNTNAISLNGYINSDSTSWLNKINNTEPTRLKSIEILPENTIQAMAFYTGNMEDFFEKTYDDEKRKNLFADIKPNLDVLPFMEMQEVLNGEMMLTNCKLGNSIYPFFICGIENEDQCDKFIESIKSNSLPYVQFNGSSDSIARFHCENITNELTAGGVTLKVNYLKRYENFLIFSESDSSLLKFLYDVESKKLLYKTETFQQFTKGNWNEECNFLWFNRIPRLNNKEQSVFNENFYSDMKNCESRINELYGSSVQLISKGSSWLMQSYMLHSPETKTETGSVWETELDTTCLQKPVITFNHRTKGNDIFIQDQSHKIYLINNSGKIVWSKKIDGNIMGKVWQLDALKNGKYQYFFNTRNTLHAIDLNGNYLEGFPIQFPWPATCGINVIDYERQKDYRVFIGCEDYRVYCYNSSGVKLNGFNSPKINSPLKQPLQWLKIGDKDYLIAVDSLGKVYGWNRKGETKFELKNKLPENISEWKIEAGRDLSKTKLITFDKSNKNLIYLSLKDKINTVGIETELQPVFYKISKINDDQSMDILIADETGFEVYDERGSKILNFASKESLIPEVEVLDINKSVYFILAESQSNLSKILSADLKTVPSSEVSSSVLLQYVKLAENQDRFLVVRTGKKITCYSFTLN